MAGNGRIVGWAHTVFGKAEAPDTEALMAQVAGRRSTMPASRPSPWTASMSA